MRATSKLLALALAAALQPAMADVVLDFETTGDLVQVGSQYASKGLTFTSDAWSVRARDLDPRVPVCQGAYLFEPLAKPAETNCGALVLAENVSGSIGDDIVKFTITSTTGFVNSISFAFALGIDAGASVDVLDAAGNSLLIGSGALSGAPCDTGFFFCNWTAGQKVEFADVAYSIVFTAKDQTLMLDDLVLVADTPPGRLPEPGSMALAVGALGAVGWIRRRAAR
jgi:hypothetical protein